MQTAASNPKLRAGSSERLAESAASCAAVQPAFTHRRGRNHLSLSWRFNLAVAVSVSALIAVSLSIQGLV